MANIVVFIRSMHALGDQLVAYPMLYQLHQFYPNHSVTVVAHDPVGAYYQHLPWVNRFVQANSALEKYHSIPKDTEILIALHHSSELYSLLGAIKRIPIRLGFKNKRVSDFLWTHSIKKDINDYIGLANLRLLGTLQVFDPLKASRDCLSWLAAQTSAAIRNTDVVFMAGGGAGAFKRWGIPNYVALADRLIQQLGQDTTFGFVLGPAEHEELKQLKALKRKEFNLFINRPMPELADLCLGAKLIVANDCGPSHIAQNSGTPYVGLFNEPNPEWFWEKANSRAVMPEKPDTDIQEISIDAVLTACLDATR